MDTPFDPSTLCQDAFLAGPDRYEEWDGEGNLIVVDPILGKEFRDMLREAREEAEAHAGPSVEPGPDSAPTEAMAAEGYSFHAVEAGLLLVAPDGTVVGGYIGCDVGIDEAHQGLGLGAELVLEYAMRNGSIPVWDHDEPGYTPAGASAHRAAHSLARNRPLFNRKCEALAAAAFSGPAP